jgi:hypothetical protein
MHEAWRRAEVESRLLIRGSAYLYGDLARWEESHGRIAATGTFECTRSEGLPASTTREPVRLTVQVRTDVVLRERVPRRDGRGTVDDRKYDDEIAIGASGGYPDQLYTWVQVFSREPEHIARFDGTSAIDIIDPDQRASDVAENELSWAGRLWLVDSDTPTSARYPIRQATAVSPNCETIYDRPTIYRVIRPWMEQHPDARRVSRTTQFHSFLYSLPLLPSERHRAPLSRLLPVVTVAWSVDETIERPEPGETPEPRSRTYRVHYIHPGGAAPPGMQRVLARVFHGR